MAVGDMIGAAVGVILLVIVAYLLVGSVLSTTQIVTNAQKSATLLEEEQLKTDVTITQASTQTDTDLNTDMDINCTIINTGNEVISDFAHMDVYVYDNNTGTYQLYLYSTSGASGTWTIIGTGTDVIHPRELDPGETYRILVRTLGTSKPSWFQITTGNAVSASAYLP
jgi:flagellar protein FlaF